ncbi:hypothetical protein POPTR_004G170392v4 [Populus trichocarpa]|uniref:Uncharacterized protein n=1 Tax=Populus trichocarpa TaxID=3694 RepID=A0ACC0T5J8_POPTR|nr:hypothetical protein POPTR_004G170392v4 [Populus trichocarpa]
MVLSHDEMVKLRSEDNSCKSLIWISSLQSHIINSSRDAQHCSPLGRAPNLHPQISNFFKEHFNSRKSPGIEINSSHQDISNSTRAVQCCMLGMDTSFGQLRILKI